MEIDLNNPIIRTVVTIVTSLLASSGFWAFIQRYLDKNDASKKLLIGIAHDRIVYLGMQYIKRGWISADEYENLHVYLYEPYREAGGNGTAEKVMTEVNKLQIRDSMPLPNP